MQFCWLYQSHNRPWGSHYHSHFKAKETEYMESKLIFQPKFPISIKSTWVPTWVGIWVPRQDDGAVGEYLFGKLKKQHIRARASQVAWKWILIFTEDCVICSLVWGIRQAIMYGNLLTTATAKSVWKVYLERVVSVITLAKAYRDLQGKLITPFLRLLADVAASGTGSGTAEWVSWSPSWALLAWPGLLWGEGVYVCCDGNSSQNVSGFRLCRHLLPDGCLSAAPLVMVSCPISGLTTGSLLGEGSGGRGWSSLAGNCLWSPGFPWKARLTYPWALHPLVPLLGRSFLCWPGVCPYPSALVGSLPFWPPSSAYPVGVPAAFSIPCAPQLGLPQWYWDTEIKAGKQGWKQVIVSVHQFSSG